MAEVAPPTPFLWLRLRPRPFYGLTGRKTPTYLPILWLKLNPPPPHFMVEVAPPPPVLWLRLHPPPPPSFMAEVAPPPFLWLRMMCCHSRETCPRHFCRAPVLYKFSRPVPGRRLTKCLSGIVVKATPLPKADTRLFAVFSN